MENIPSWVVPGQKVICIGNFKISNMKGINRIPKFKEILTIRSSRMFESGLGLRFKEIQNPEVLLNTFEIAERAYSIKFFRPLVNKSQEDDIELFKKHLIEKTVDMTV